MTWRNRQANVRPSKPKPRGIVVKYPGNCLICGGRIEAGESAVYYPVGTIASVYVPHIAHLRAPA